MEKQIYITQTPHYSELNQNNIYRDKHSSGGYTSHLDTAKLNNRKFMERLPPETYYADKKIKPGISLFKTIIEIEDRRSAGQYNGPVLNMAIPETVLLTENTNSMIYVDQGVVKVESFTTNESFLDRMELKRGGGNAYPCMIHSSISGIGFSNSIVMNSEIIGNKMLPRNEGFICRKFITPFKNTPNLLRLFFTPKNERHLKKNFAYKMVNFKEMEEEMFKKKHRLIFNYILSSQMEDSYSLTMIRGKALQHCQDMTESLIEYLEKGINIRISQIVLDFIIDDNKQAWLHEIKSIKSTTLTKLWDIGSISEIELLTEKNNNSQMCKLCGMMYSKYEMEKLVTNKLIWELTSHFQRRGVSFTSLPHLKQQGFSYVCDICYEVIVAEHKLINVEKEFSNILNIAPNTIERVMTKAELSKAQSALLLQEQDFNESGNAIPRLKSWRLFFYLQKIKNYEKREDTKFTIINIEMKFKNFREHFTKHVSKENPELSKVFKSRYSSASRIQSAKLQKHSILYDGRHANRINTSKVSKGKTNETLTTVASKVTTSLVKPEFIKQSFSLEKVKVYTLYTKKHHSRNIFYNTEIEFILTVNDEKFTGRSLTLEELKNKDTCQRHSSQIFLFDQKLKYCNLELTVGLICDGDLYDDNIELGQIDGIYYPSKPFSICKPLPEQWMEVFTKGEEIPAHTQELSYQQIVQSHLRKQSQLRESLISNVLDF